VASGAARGRRDDTGGGDGRSSLTEEEPHVVSWSRSDLSMHQETLRAAWGHGSTVPVVLEKSPHLLGEVDGDMSAWSSDWSAVADVFSGQEGRDRVGRGDELVGGRRLPVKA
jgi:hypothetical protein